VTLVRTLFGVVIVTIATIVGAATLGHHEGAAANQRTVDQRTAQRRKQE
jgi:hypothetical protein